MEIGDVWRLHDDDGVVADLVVREADWPWLFATVAPTPAFERLRPLFAEELRLVEADMDVPAWEAAYQRVADAVSLAYPDGRRVPEFLLHIDGLEAWWRWSDEPF
jgi:hypothetical protein